MRVYCFVIDKSKSKLPVVGHWANYPKYKKNYELPQIPLQVVFYLKFLLCLVPGLVCAAARAGALVADSMLGRRRFDIHRDVARSLLKSRQRHLACSSGGTVAGAQAAPALAMPFIEDEWWTAENEGRMVDLSNCLQDAVAAANGSAAAQLQQMATSVATSLGELSQAELSTIVGGLNLENDSSEAADPDDILKQLGETAFDNFDTFFTDLTNSTASSVPPIEIKQEENNNISSPSSSQLQGSYYQPSGPLLQNHGQQRLQQLLRQGNAINNAAHLNNSRYNIASQNPLLAEKLAATSSNIKQEPLSTDYNGTSMNYGSASPMQRVPSGKPQVHDAGGGKG
ncbi:unnamed protein product [Plutella xylostella]|uniref:(diamondback moth) hypothetical protein n=1 Tax=Plutella xylostella TaxID=51655 RepID=A0A8S4FZN8_PLUXY|nr:unnamed protein product [Plutella xylostella]